MTEEARRKSEDDQTQRDCEGKFSHIPGITIRHITVELTRRRESIPIHRERRTKQVSEPAADRGPQAGSPRGVVDAGGHVSRSRCSRPTICYAASDVTHTKH